MNGERSPSATLPARIRAAYRSNWPAAVPSGSRRRSVAVAAIHDDAASGDHLLATARQPRRVVLFKGSELECPRRLLTATNAVLGFTNRSADRVFDSLAAAAPFAAPLQLRRLRRSARC